MAEFKPEKSIIIIILNRSPLDRGTKISSPKTTSNSSPVRGTFSRFKTHFLFSTSFREKKVSFQTFVPDFSKAADWELALHTSEGHGHEVCRLRRVPVGQIQQGKKEQAAESKSK